MPVQVAFELSDANLEHFRRALDAVRSRTRSRADHEIVAAALRLVTETAHLELPEFIRARLGQLGLLLDMLSDTEWRIEGAPRARVIDALAYFAEPADLIPDEIPVIGFLDDAIMIELVVQEIHHELDAYAEFCRYREEQHRRSELGELDPETRRHRLEARRHAMFNRIEDRRARRERHGLRLFALGDGSDDLPY
jgi:uncharacterized membrane protein YkvA (DUF1232 family)